MTGLGWALQLWAAAGGLGLLSLSAPPNAGTSVSWPPRTGCQLEAAGTELMPGKWVELGRDEKAFVSPVCVQMGTDFPDTSGGCEEQSQVLSRPTPQTFPQSYTLAALSTPQALLSQLLPFMRSVVAEFWLNIC